MVTQAKEAKPTKKIPMQRCKFCEEVLPANKMFKHWSEKHPEYAQELRRRGGQHRAKTANPPAGNAGGQAGGNAGSKQDSADLENEAKKNALKEEQQVKGRFVTKVVDLPGDILVLYWLAKAAFPEYDSTEGEWIADCVRQFYAEHSEELGLDKLFDKTYETVPMGGEK